MTSKPIPRLRQAFVSQVDPALPGDLYPPGGRAGLARSWRRVLGVLAALTTLLAACGGSTSQVDPFVARRILALGDETSVLTAAGHTYSVNALTDTGALDCAAQPIWVQAVANRYGIVFGECNPNGVAEPQGLMLAGAGAKAADLTTQVDAGGVQDGDLATVLIGANDVLELYRQYPGRAEAELVAELQVRGAAAAAQVNRLVGLGARVLLATVPDIGLTPYGLAERAAHTDTDRVALLTRLVDAFNVAMRVGILNDGRHIGLVLADEMVQAMVKSPGNFSLRNTTDAACTTAPPDCSAATLVTGATSATYLWSDELNFAYGGQLRLGELARSRASNNPF